MTHHFAARAALALVVAVLVAGCSDPYHAATQSPTVAGTPHVALPGGELPGRIPAAARAQFASPDSPPAPTRHTALRAYALAAGDWAGSTIARVYRTLARVAVGEARRDAQQTAAAAAGDPELTRPGTSSHVELLGIVDQPDGWALVVTRARTTPAGTTQYLLTRAHTRAIRGGFAVDQWQPQS